MNGVTLLLGLAAVSTCVALVRVFAGITRSKREPRTERRISEPRSLVTVLRSSAELEAAVDRALRFEAPAGELLRRRVERYAATASSRSVSGAVLDFPTWSEPGANSDARAGSGRRSA